MAAGTIDHAIRLAAPRTASAYVWPASHKAATGGASDGPMGTWFRLKAGFDISGFSPANQVILRAIEKHGMVLADNGSPWFISGAPTPGWNDSDLGLLRRVPGSAFEAVDVSSLPAAAGPHAVSGPTGTTTGTTAAPTTTTTTAPPATTWSPPPASTRASPAGTPATTARARPAPAPLPQRILLSRALTHQGHGGAVLDDSPNTGTSATAGPTEPPPGSKPHPAVRSPSASASTEAPRSSARPPRRRREQEPGNPDRHQRPGNGRQHHQRRR